MKISAEANVALEWARDQGVQLVVGPNSTHVHALKPTDGHAPVILCADHRQRKRTNGLGPLHTDDFQEASIVDLAEMPVCGQCRRKAEYLRMPQ